MRNKFILCSCLLIGASSLSATPVEATFTGVNGMVAFNNYVGPYNGTLAGDAVTLYCVDFNNEVSFGEDWMANLSHINAKSNLANTRYGGIMNSVTLYQEAAWLTEQYALNPTSAYADIQATIWQLFDPFAPTPSSGYWLAQAQAHYASADFSNFVVVTNVGPVTRTGQVQEFLTVISPSNSIEPFDNPQPVPEPALAGVIGIALIGFVFGVRRLRRRNSGSA
jgi:hypothetical protein